MIKKILITCFVTILLVSINSITNNNYSAAQKEDNKIEFSNNYKSSLDKNLETLLSLINNERINNKLDPLEWNGNLYLSALKRSQEITIKWSQIRPDNTPYYTINNLIKTEIIVKGYQKPEQIFDIIISKHKDILLNKNHQIIGISYYIYNKEFYWSFEIG